MILITKRDLFLLYDLEYLKRYGIISTSGYPDKFEFSIDKGTTTMDNLPPLRSLQIFDVLGRSNGVAETARKLNISAGAVSQQIKILELALGLSLTIKDGKHIRLTQAGEQYHIKCAKAFESMRIAQIELDDSLHNNPIKISALPSLMSKWLMPAAFQLQQQQSDINLYLAGEHAEPSEEGIEIDFRLTYSERTLHAKHSAPLFTDIVIPVCSPSLLNRTPKIERPQDILNYPLLSVDWLPKFISPPSWRDWINHYTESTIAVKDKHLVCSLSSMTIEAAIQGQGVALAQYSMIQSDLKTARLICPFYLPLPLPSAYYLTWQKRSFEKPHSASVYQWLLQQGERQQKEIEKVCQQASRYPTV